MLFEASGDSEVKSPKSWVFMTAKVQIDTNTTNNLSNNGIYLQKKTLQTYESFKQLLLGNKTTFFFEQTPDRMMKFDKTKMASTFFYPQDSKVVSTHLWNTPLNL